METLKAVVQKIIKGGKHGAFAIATSDQIEGSITFSLEPTVWEEKDWPEEGMMVLLAELRQKRAGWRAKEGRFWKPSDEQIENRKEQDMSKKAKVFMQGLKNKWFPAGDDKVWKRWVYYKRRETRDLIELLSSDVRDSFKRRALFLLLVPSADLNPIYWTEEVGKFYQGSDFLKTLTPDLLSYATDLIVEFDTMLKPAHCDRSKNVAEGGGSITVFMSIPDKYHDALYFYNNCILILLKLLPTEQGERIFPLFSLRDISTYWGIDDASGYNPFKSLLYSEVDESWKSKADVAMRGIIQSEVAGKTKPREEWEDALRCYAHIISLQLYGDKLNYSVDMFADQMQFLIDKAHFGHELIQQWNVLQIYKVLSDDRHKGLRRLIAKFMVLGNGKEFSVYDDSSLKTAEIMLSELNQEDSEIVTKIQTAIEKGKKFLVKRQKKQTAFKQSEAGIMAQMK